MNNVILIGRLTRNPDVRRTDSTAIGRFTLAVDRQFKREGEPTADFISCVAFGKNAEFVEKYLHRATKIAIIGRIQTGSYTNKDGNKVYTTDVIVDRLEFVESKKPDEGGSSTDQTTPEKKNEDFMKVPESSDDELPFN